jgi:hypothetical protein
MKPATRKIRLLYAKLETLTERGINGEQDAAFKKLDRLKARYDFSAPKLDKDDLFAGIFQRASTATPVYQFNNDDFSMSSSVKWAIEKATGINCCFRNSEMLAEATPKTANKLAQIAKTITESFCGLWAQFKAAQGVTPADHGVFVMGLYDGMMDDAREVGQRLPMRTGTMSHRKAKKRSVEEPAGLGVHPYSVALGLGKQIRFSVPFNLIAEQLDNIVQKQLPT